MSNQKDYVPVQLIIKIGDCLLAVDGLGHQVYSARYLEKNHLSGRAQDHFRHHESVSVMQLYAAIRILLLNTSSVWDRILQMCRILDILEQCFCDCYSGVTLHPFDGGMEKNVRDKMLSVAGLRLRGGDKRCGGVEKEGVSISPFRHKALIHKVFTFASEFLKIRIIETKEYFEKEMFFENLRLPLDDFSTSPSLLQGELHILTKPSLLEKGRM